MRPSIRLRIAVFVLAAIAVCQVMLSAFVLVRLERLQRDAVDALLVEQLAEVEALLGTPQLAALIEMEGARQSKWNETFFEIRGAGGDLLAASRNVPARGLARPPEAREHDSVAIWEQVHPQSRKGHRNIRVAETTLGGHLIHVGRGMKRQEKTYLRLRSQLVWGVLGVALLGSLAAWGVATRSLAPLRSMSARARELGLSLDGHLPRTGRGDELDELAGVLNELLQRLRAELLRVRRMTADAAHALKTPLTSIRGNLELQLRSAGAASRPALISSLEALDELSVLIHRLLLLERLESRPLRPDQLQPLRLDRLAADLVDTWKAVAFDRGIDLRYESHPATVRGDPEQLRTAIANLLDNSLRHTPKGGRVDVLVQRSSDMARLTVCDSGRGLAPEQLERVFERFHSEPGRGSGIGLGLPISRAIARSHRGSLQASPSAAPGQGARFDLELPLDRPARAGPAPD